MTPTVAAEQPAQILRKAERAHAEYERDIGRRDEGGPTWYARYIIDRLGHD